ncbi:DUF3772 domain-containing protein [Ostreiculturibacter nitratireducens]|uniref:DUF3772 domain-containing protein n=1 Tax=Ostreiculturibacter nitratireducens TaxID=3075226 RepID=UPI0031B5B4A3
MKTLRALSLAFSLALTALAAPAPFGVSSAAAQEAAAPAAPDYAAWERDATRAEDALEAGRASNLALEQLRQQIVDWRTKFSAAQTANDARLQTLRGQIAALGPAPAEGETEAPEIATRRKELNDQLARLQAPGIAAVEAYSRADGIIREIDTTIRERQASALLKLSPSPANPVNWPAGLAVLTQGMRTLWQETSGAWENPARRKELRDNLPAILLYLLIAGLLMVRGPGFFERLAGRMRVGGSEYARRLAAGFVSLGQVVLPVGGMYLLVQAMEATGMTGLRSGALIAAFPGAALAFFATRWLGGLLFPVSDRGPLDRSQSILPENSAEARFHTTMVGLLLAAELLRRAFITEVRPPLSQSAQSVWAAPVVLVISLFLFRLGLLLRHMDATLDDGEANRFRARMRRLVGSAVVAVSVLGPLMAIVGYTTAANALVWPTVLSLGLIGILILAQRFVGDIYGMIVRPEEGAPGGLVPVLIGFALAIAAIPLFALIWGARVADLAEVWTRFREGVSIGQTRISPTVFLTFVAVFVVGLTATRLLQGALRASVLPKTKLDKGGQNAIVSGVGYLGIFLAAVIAITSAGIDLSSLAIVAGALSVGIGFGLQNIVSNFVSGIILLIERPISEGDWIEVGGQMGIVKAISVRSTRIETFDRTDVIVPNADLVSGVVTNWTRGNLTGRLIVPVGVAYGTDTKKVEAILHEVAEAHPLVVVNPPPNVYFVGFGADSLNFEIRAILRDVNFKLATHSEMNHEIASRFAEEGIEIPFPQRDIWLKNPEALRPPEPSPRAMPGAGGAGEESA